VIQTLCKLCTFASSACFLLLSVAKYSRKNCKFAKIPNVSQGRLSQFMKHAQVPKCSLIIATYNWPEALRLCLNSVKRQSALPDEVIIADDGSKQPTGDLIQEFKTSFPVPIVHIWQPDEGFQLARIRNKAFAAAKFPYVIQIDGDLILHDDFVKDHLNLARRNHFVTGSRVLLDKLTTERLLQDAEYKYLNIFNGKSSNFLNGLRIGFLRRYLSSRYKIEGKHKYYVKGCNMAFWKSDLLKVNGYNEAFTGWGREDSELAIRLINACVKKQFIKVGGICYHLFHKEASRELEPRNIKLMNDAIANKTIVAEKGIQQHLDTTTS
jgi:glycosyltransferase involved in cell wall biosynthesis